MLGLYTFGAVALVSGAGLEGTDSSVPGIVQFPVNRLKSSDPLVRRDTDTNGTVAGTLSNLQSYYAIQCSLGTPEQEMQLLMDTGSSDFWVIDSSLDDCGVGSCNQDSKFSSLDSSTFHSNNTMFYQEYADSSTVNGTWAEDVLSIGGAKINNFNFAVANDTSSEQGVAGIGLPKGETPYILGDIDSPYANLPMQLKSSGLISHMAYSLYLDAYSDATGTILFGGINEGAYEGDLYRFPLVPVDSDEIDRLAIKMQSLWVVNNKGEQQKFADLSIPVVFDSGSTLSTLPSTLLQPLMQSIGAQYTEDEGVGLAYAECSQLKNNHGGLGFTFGDVEFVVNFRDLLIEGNRGYCIVGFQANNIAVFGDNILRSLYVVYDLENMEIAMAKANTNSTIQNSYKTIDGTIPGKPAPGYNDTDIDYNSITHQITIFGNDHATASSNSPDDPDIPTTTPAPVQVTVGGTASKAGIAPTYKGSSSANSGGIAATGQQAQGSASRSGVNGLLVIFLGCFSVFLVLL